MSRSVKYFFGLLCIAFLIFGESQASTVTEDKSFWRAVGAAQLNKVLSQKDIHKKAKNVILFIGDGMGISTITAGRIYKGQMKGHPGEEYKLSFEEFPNTALSKTYNVNSQVTDSAAGATALFSGVKTGIWMVGLDGTVQYNMCDKKKNEKSKVETLATWAQNSGLDTGFVTTTRVSHATPAGLYAHSNNRAWECDIDIPKKYRTCLKDIARQLVEDEPGRNFKVIMGGGDRCMCVNKKNCGRADGIRPADMWQRDNPAAKIVTTKEELLSLDVNNVTKVMGIFSPTHFPYQAQQKPNVPSLENMTRTAIKMLQKSENGFFLMVEGGKIDLAHHANKAMLAFSELSDLDNAIQTALSMVDLEETLIVVTADHSHTLTMSGYPKRGNNILGMTEKKTLETLSYATGPAYRDYASPASNTDSYEDSPHQVNLNQTNFAGKYSKRAKHGGEDVGVFAIGAYSHLIRGTFEQNYIPYAIAYAACYTGFESHCSQ